ncbi:MAG: hypothetical protein DMF91_15355 [Acidobacteria bacterium]|nr:MAG: hypothetical protein DMF91_15355 [Acidobacteriota bacterium]
MKAVKSGIGGWLLVLCLLLLIWQPISLGLVASSMLDALASGGLPAVLILLTRLIVTGFGIAAGLALLGRRPGAVTLAKVSLALSAATDVFVYTTPFFPSNRAPGETPVYIAVSVTYSIVWIVYLFRSKRVRETFSI